MSLENAYQPQLIEEAETLLGTPFFTREADYDIDDYSSERHGLERFIYTACCRVLARARAEDRLQASTGADSNEYDPVAWNEQWESAITPRRIARIAMKFETEVSALSRQLALVNNATTFVEDNWYELKERLHEDQQAYMLDIMASLRMPPRVVEYADGPGRPEKYVVQGTTIIAPTGFGKTRLIEVCAKMFEPGKPLKYSSHVAERTRIVIVSPSLVLLDQTAAELARELPGVRVGKMHGGTKEPEADIVLSTIETFNSEFENGYIGGEPVAVVMVDEAHHLSEPQFRKTFVTQWRGPSLVFTATPAYDLERDIRAIIPNVVEKTNILKSIDKGTLNDGQVHTFFIDSDVYNMLLERYGVNSEGKEAHSIIRHVIDSLVLEYVTPLLAEGRRGIIFCESGAQAHWANIMAERLRGLELPDGRPVRAEAMHSYADNQLEAVEKFRRGQLDVLTTVDTGREGLDANFDFVIVNCNIVSRLRGHQIVGRGTRRSREFPTTVYGQFSYRIEGTWFEKLYSIEEAFGNTLIEAGRTIRERLGTKGGLGRAVVPVDTSAFSGVILGLLERIERKPIGEAFIGANRGRREVVEGLISLPDIILGFHATELRAKKLLRNAGYPWYGRSEGTGSNRRLVHYYTPEARDYLHQVLPKGTHLTPEETAKTIGVPLAAVKKVIAQYGIAGQYVARGNIGQPPLCYNQEERDFIERIAKKIPGVNPGDRKLGDVAREYRLSAETIWKWSGAEADQDRIDLGGVRYLTAAELLKVQQEYEKVPKAGDQEMNIMRIAERAGVNHQVVKRHLSDEDWLAATEKRYKDKRGFTRVTHVWPADRAADIASRMEKFRSRPLEAHVLPTGAVKRVVRNFTATPSTEIARILAEGGFAVQEMIIAGSRSMSRCLSWVAIAHLQEQLGAMQGARSLVLDYSRLPVGPDDTDPDKIAYAQSIQAQFLDIEQLKKYDTMES